MDIFRNKGWYNFILFMCLGLLYIWEVFNFNKQQMYFVIVLTLSVVFKVYRDVRRTKDV